MFFLSHFAGGTCWLKKMDGGKCNNIFTKNVQKEECCAAGTDLGWSENDVSDAELFFMAALNSGMACSSCVGMRYFLEFNKSFSI